MGITYTGKFFFIHDSIWSKRELEKIRGRSHSFYFGGFDDDYAEKDAIYYFWYLDIEEPSDC